MKVKSIKKIGFRETYDLTVRGDANYLVDGQVVHNCLKDVSRVLEVPYAAVNEVTNSIIERSSGDERASQTIEDSFKDFAVCRAFNEKYPDVLKHARRLEGMSKNLGIHAAGVVTSPVPLVEITPLEVRKHSDGDVVVTAVDMNGAQAHGLLKLDVLGLRTLAVLKDAVNAAQTRHGVEIDLERLELDDEKVLQSFTDHDYVGIFQYDSPSADKICMGVPFDSFEDVAAMTALNRPGTARSGLATEYVERKKHPEKRKHGHFHPKVSEITADTMGVIVYQEHVQKIFVEIAGFPPGTADSLRKKIAKKYGDETIGKERENFIRGAKEHSGIDEKTAGKIMDAITFFGCLSGETLIYTTKGWKRIDSLKFGDRVCSVDDSGELVTNVVKAIGESGIKDVYGVKTSRGEVAASADHWWKVGKYYKRTKELAFGDVLSYPMDLKHIGGNNENMRCGRMRIESISERDVFYALSKRVSKKENRGRDSSRISKCENGNKRERMEGRVGQVSSVDKETLRCYEKRKKSCLDRRSVRYFQRGKSGIAFPRLRMRMVRKNSGYQPSCAEYEKSSRSPHRSRSFKQFARKSCSNMSIVPFFGTYERKSGRSKEAIVERPKKIGKKMTYDLECEGKPANYITTIGVVHNSYGFNKSHATSYGVIAYWGMWLKVYYPLEFYWALLKNTPDRIRIQSFAKDAKKHGIELLPPDVSVSKREFAIDPNRDAIRGSLVDIKGVGQGASESIMKNQPYGDFYDFLDRVERRKVHKGVVLALAKSGALDELVPNVKWLVENIEDFWKKYGNKKTRESVLEIMENSKSQPDYSDEEKQLIASKVNPLAFGRHPIDAYSEFISREVKVPLISMSEEDFWKNNNGDGIYICGVILEVRYNQIGDFHTGELPSESDREKMFWGSRYANVNVEDAGGSQNRTKFDIDIFDENRELIDSGIGTPVIIHAVPNERFENLNAHFAIDLEKYRKKIEDKKELNIWERIISGKHPAAEIKWKPSGSMSSEEVFKQRTINELFFKGRTKKFTGVVMQVRFKYDKNDNIMSFFSMLDAAGNSIDCICFASNWNDKLKGVIKSGNLLSIELDKKRDIRNKKKFQYFFNGGRIHWYKNSTSK
jgi:DNA polymerase III alpha subunit